MTATVQTETTSKLAFWSGIILSALPVLFLLLDAVLKLFKPPPVVEASLALGFTEAQIPVLGIILLVCLIFYLLPRTAVFGAVLLTGYLGGVEATHLRAGSDAFSFVFPIILGVLLWGGLFVRDAKLRELIPLRR